MPTIAVNKADLFASLGREYSTHEFDELCFEFGIELDEDTTDQDRREKDGSERPPELKIEIPANRYDMLCIEGISKMLNIFLGRDNVPNYRLAAPPGGEMQQITVHESTLGVRQYISAAVLRGVTFTQARYESFIALQDKLHQNLCRQRTLVSMGTHDLDHIQGPFTYEALPPQDIKFVALNQTKEMNATQLFEHYDQDETGRHLAKFLPIIRDSPLYPVVLDRNRNVCSLPPIINSELSKITLDTRNVLIEITATDKTKAEIVCHILVAMFSGYCDEPFSVEPVKIVSPHNHESREVPDMTPRSTTAEVSYINSCTGLSLTAQEMCEYLKRMSYIARPSTTDKDLLDVDIPVNRADVLHQCDIMEDVAIAYGFNKLEKTFPGKSGTIAKPLPVNKLSDIVRLECAMAGWSEVMPLILCSHDENFAHLNRKDDGTTAIRLANPKTAEYQVVRTTLLPGILKTIRENRKHALPIRVFEVSDVAFKDDSSERKTRNERHMAAAWCGKTSGFEVVHGLLDRVMAMLRTAFVDRESGADGYWIEELKSETYFPGRAAEIWYRKKGQEKVIGSFGVLHPSVLKAFEILYPVSTLEINIEVFL
ncbi:phenylalanine--tRNA ligase beta subunit [Drechslerella stenobrocha 248]|uniref:Phenylalanine--tRNA ligase beta subunit n=1 Tax=Drechslerella stenobrocha 248 TaxID=1043628 RepID=W7HSJ3_9PEZI|nr:phenylalanine--tRNA ligase beta subunit [Drechslerella stenobrocha 248]